MYSSESSEKGTIGLDVDEKKVPTGWCKRDILTSERELYMNGGGDAQTPAYN